MKQLLFFLLFILLPLMCLSQYKTIKGVTTNNSKYVISDTKVWCSVDSIFTFTDNNGEFTINVPSTVDTLYFSKTGYKQFVTPIGSNSYLKIQLEIESFFDLSLDDILKTKVRTVSLQEQSVNYAPGVITIITKQDLQRFGVRTLKEALIMVAGYSLMQNDDEQIFSVRGIFATTNQKILVMRDGHSLNEANLDIPQTEYSLSIENIKKIEIIRGSGASIYGNSALASVINIITDVKESTVFKIEAGNYGQFNADGYSCSELKKGGNILVFGRYSTTSGQPFSVGYSTVYQQYKNTYKAGHYPNNFDIGFRYTKKKLSISSAARRHEYKTYWTSQGTYTNVDSLLAKPGLKSNSGYIEIKYEPEVNENLSLHFIHYVDYDQLVNHRLVSAIDSIKYINGRMQLNEWNTSKLGINYYGLWKYSKKGGMLAGFSLERRNYLDSWVASNTIDSSKLVFSTEPFFPKGNELRGALYIQGQYDLFKWLTLDLGARYDLSQEYSYSFNPRIAFILLPGKSFNLKFIYTEAFQAPGYSYRNSNAVFSGSISKLQPEKLNTIQASIRFNYEKSSYIELTGYYNRLKNLITRTTNNYYENYGKVASFGLELDLRHNMGPIYLLANYSLLLPDTMYIDPGFNERNIYKNEFRHFPMQTINTGINYSYKNTASISLYGQYTSGFYTLNQYLVNSRFTLNSTLKLNAIKNISFYLKTYNLLNKSYKLGDPSVFPIEQPGRWWLFTISFNY